MNLATEIKATIRVSLLQLQASLAPNLHHTDLCTGKRKIGLEKRLPLKKAAKIEEYFYMFGVWEKE